MSCSLTISTGAEEDFTGAVGAEVTLGVAGKGVSLVHVRYGDQPITSDPPVFTILDGATMLVVVAEATKPGALVQLLEVCGGSAKQVLNQFHFDPMNPARGYVVRGA